MQHSSFGKLCFHLLLYLLLVCCSRKNIQYTYPVYDSQTEATVITPRTGGGKHQLPAHSILEFKVDGVTYNARSFEYYRNLLKGEKFKIKYNSRNTYQYDIRFGEPIFSEGEDIIRTVGCIMDTKITDTLKGLSDIFFVYEVIPKKRDSTEIYYMSFVDKHQYVKGNGRSIAKPGVKYVVYYQRGFSKRAILYTDSIVDDMHLKENTYYYKAGEMMERERYKRVIHLLDKTLQIDPTNGQALYARGKAYYQLDRYKKAASDFTSYIDHHPATYDGYWSRAMVEFKQGSDRLAINDLNKAIFINPDSEADLYYYRGMVYYRLKDKANAIDNYNKAIEINPNVGEYYHNRAVAKVKQAEDVKAGNNDYHKAVDLHFKGSKKALRSSKVQNHEIKVNDFKQPWSKL